MEPEENVLRGDTLELEGVGSVGEESFKKMLERGDRVAMVDAETEEEETFTSMRIKGTTIALALSSRGITQDDIVTIIERTCFEVFSITLGVMFTGAAVNVLDSGWTAESVLPIQIPLLEPKIIFCYASAEDLLQDILQANDLQTEVIVYGGDSKHGNKSYEEFFAEFENSEDLDTYQPTVIEDIYTTTAAIACTSGSTGNPKGVMVPHASLHQLISPLKGKNLQDITIFTNSGLSWGSGLFILLGGLIGGARKVFTKEPFSEENLLVVMNKYKPGIMLLSCFQVSLMNAYLQDKPEEAKPFSYLYFLFAVGSKLSPHQVYAMQKHLGSGKLVVTYGLTECMGGCTTIKCPEYRPNTVGHVNMNIEFKFVDIESGENLGPNQEGEIYLRGPTMLGYYGNPEATAEVLDPVTRWFKTGDIGHYDEDGYIYITDRIKEIAKYKGVYINPSDIEDVICHHPSVRSAAVVSIPHDEVCDLMVAYVELLPEHKDSITAEELEAYCNENVKEYEKLRGGLYLVDKLPVLSHGKIAKTKVKNMAKEMKDMIYERFNTISSKL